MTKITRRSLLAAMSALTGSAGVGTSPRNVAAAIAAGTALAENNWENNAATPGPAYYPKEDSSSWWNVSIPLQRKLERRLFQVEKPSIRHGSKKSWSVVFRHSIEEKEFTELDNLLRALNNQSTGKKIFDLLVGEKSNEGAEK